MGCLHLQTKPSRDPDLSHGRAREVDRPGLLRHQLNPFDSSYQGKDRGRGHDRDRHSQRQASRRSRDPSSLSRLSLLGLSSDSYLPVVQDVVLGEVGVDETTRLVQSPHQLHRLSVAPAHQAHAGDGIGGQGTEPCSLEPIGNVEEHLPEIRGMRGSLSGTGHIGPRSRHVAAGQLDPV